MDKIGNHNVYNLNYHIVFCPKRRKSILVDKIATDCQDILQDVASKVNVKIESISILPDHVHLFVSSNPNISPHLIIKKFKGATSNILRKKYPQLLKLPCLWSRAYYIGSVGSVSESIIRAYIENQKNK